MNLTSTTLPLHHRGLLEVIDTFPKTQANFWKDIIGRELNTNELYEELVQFSGLGVASNINESGGVPYDTATTPFSKRFFLNIYALGYEISPNALAKDVYGVLKAPSKWMAQGHYLALEQACADIINNSTSTVGIDGVALNSTSHPTATSTWSNQSSQAALSIGSLEQMLNDVQLQKAYRDYPYVATGPFNLVHPTGIDMLAKRLLAGTEQPQTADRDKNVARDLIRYVPANPFLTNQTRYALVPTSSDDNPIFLLRGMPMRVEEMFDARVPSKLYVTMQEFTTGWTKANGVQFNEGF
jgi:hypothetical protein